MDLLAAMRIYIRTVERGGLSAAGRDLGLAQPTVSERIEALERHLGVRLLDRTTRSVRPTDIGLAFYERAKLAVEAAEDARAVATSLAGSLRGTLRIAAPHGLGEIGLPAILASLQTRHPDLAIDLTLNDRFVDPLAEGVDLSIRVGRLGEGHFVARRIGSIRRVLVASPAYLAAWGTPKLADDLGRHRFLRVTGLAMDDRLALIGPDGSKITAAIQTCWRANHWRPLLDAALSGLGIAALQLPFCRDEIAIGRLLQVLVDHAFEPIDVHVIYPAGPGTPLKTRAALDLLAQSLPAFLDQDAAD